MTNERPSAESSSKRLWSIVLVELTNCCNFSCDFCPSDSQSRPRTRMPRGLWEKVLKEIGEKKLSPSVFFHQLGEPLLHPEVFEAIEYANSLGLSVSLYTNGALLDDERSRKLLAVLKKGRVVLSLQDIHPKAFEKRSRGALSWETYILRLKNFLWKADAAGFSMQIHALADVRSFGWNITKILREQKAIQKVYEDFADGLGVRPHRVSILNPLKSYSLGETTSFYIKHRGTWDNQLVPPGLEVVKAERGHCSVMQDTFVVQADGKCTYCCCDHEGELGLGDANTSSLEDIFYGEKSLRIIASEKKGWMIEERCQACRGRLVDARTKRPVLDRPLYLEYYYFCEHLERYGWMSVFKKTVANIRRRSLK